MVKSTERAPGIYRATFTALDLDYRITDKETGEEVRRWRWVFQEVKDPTTVGEIDTISSPSLAKGTNGLKFFTGMLGRPPVPDVDDTDELVGQTFDVTYGPNQNGRLTIIGVTRVGLDDQPVPKITVGEAGLEIAKEIIRKSADVPMTTLPNQVPGELP